MIEIDDRLALASLQAKPAPFEWHHSFVSVLSKHGCISLQGQEQEPGEQGNEDCGDRSRSRSRIRLPGLFLVPCPLGAMVLHLDMQHGKRQEQGRVSAGGEKGHSPGRAPPGWRVGIIPGSVLVDINGIVVVFESFASIQARLESMPRPLCIRMIHSGNLYDTIFWERDLGMALCAASDMAQAGTVEEDSTAWEAGVRAGDIIVGVDDAPMATVDFKYCLSNLVGNNNSSSSSSSSSGGLVVRGTGTGEGSLPMEKIQKLSFLGPRSSPSPVLALDVALGSEVVSMLCQSGASEVGALLPAGVGVGSELGVGVGVGVGVESEADEEAAVGSVAAVEAATVGGMVPFYPDPFVLYSCALGVGQGGREGEGEGQGQAALLAARWHVRDSILGVLDCMTLPRPSSSSYSSSCYHSLAEKEQHHRRSLLTAPAPTLVSLMPMLVQALRLGGDLGGRTMRFSSHWAALTLPVAACDQEEEEEDGSSPPPSPSPSPHPPCRTPTPTPIPVAQTHQAGIGIGTGVEGLLLLPTVSPLLGSPSPSLSMSLSPSASRFATWTPESSPLSLPLPMPKYGSRLSPGPPYSSLSAIGDLRLAPSPSPGTGTGTGTGMDHYRSFPSSSPSPSPPLPLPLPLPLPTSTSTSTSTSRFSSTRPTHRVSTRCGHHQFNGAIGLFQGGEESRLPAQHPHTPTH